MVKRNSLKKNKIQFSSRNIKKEENKWFDDKEEKIFQLEAELRREKIKNFQKDDAMKAMNENLNNMMKIWGEEDKRKESKIKYLKNILFSKKECIICLEEVLEMELKHVTNCCHVFHCLCLAEWENDFCPLCKSQLNDEDLTKTKFNSFNINYID